MMKPRINKIFIKQAEAIALRGEAEAYAIEVKAKAEAEQMAKKADAWNEYKEAALVDMMLKVMDCKHPSD